MKFKPEDFYRRLRTPNEEDYSETALTPSEAANYANATLEKWLKDAPTIVLKDKGFKAKLVCIEELHNQ